MGRRTVLLITSVLLAAVGTAIVALYVRGADDRATEGQALGTYVVALRDIETGVEITAQDVQTQQMRAGDQPTTTATRIDAVVGRRAQVRVLQGTTIDERVLSLPGAEVDEESAVRADELGVTVQLEDPNRAAALLGVGSWVRIFTLRDEKATEIVEKARVISIGATVQTVGAAGPDGKNAVGSTAIPPGLIGLSVPPPAARAILGVQMQQQPLYFAVIPTADARDDS
ncbi:SAF domain-containing protein [Kineosporia sp. NBRC 101677]|uniref:SAF domain-containing protein n=1 Tax=Kineosporia sp. NBRC 101677 TaxID=3032197 RepID=UPI0025538239|nr:SAF domain-containing protein [Kineosporia sp. NBRC 101677]